MKKLLVVGVILIISVFIVSCAGSGTTTPTPGASTTKPVSTTAAPTQPLATTVAKPTTATPQYGGVLRMLTTSLATNVGNPALAMGPPENALMAIEPLTSFDEKGNLIPELATSWELDAKAQTITLHLRKGVKFHDGTIFDAEACKWNFEQRMKSGKIAAAEVVSIEVLDENTVRVNLKRFNALQIITFTHTVMMYSPTAIKTNGEEWAKTHIVGTGPFKQTDYKDASYWKFTRNENYWGPKPYLDGMEYIVVADATVANLSMRSGAGDMWKSGATAKDCIDLAGQGFDVVQRSASVYFLAWDSLTPSSPFNNQKVREAAEYALDRPAIAKAVGYGSYKELFQFANPQDLPYNPDVQARAYNPQKAKQLLSEGGYPNGFQTKLFIRSESTDTATFIQSYLGAVGIKVDIDVCDSARWLSITGPTGWKDGMIYTMVGRNAGYSYIQFSLGGQFKVQPNTAFQNMAKSQTFADLYNQLMAVPTLEDSIAVGKKMVKQLSDECIAVPLWNGPYNVVVQKYVHTNYLSVHHQIWNSELDWMGSH
jgi:peptide/nickel transport system substrate-binding protein